MSYGMFILYGAAYSLSITITATKIAENLSDESYGLVFGFNTFLALVTQTMLTLTVVSYGFRLNVRDQYVVYGSIYLVLGFLYALLLSYDLVKKKIWVKSKDFKKSEAIKA